MQPQVRIYTASTSGALRQGEIVTGLMQLRVEVASIATSDESAVIQPIVHPFAIVLSQDCDLDWDYKARQQQAAQEKLLPNVLFCQVITAAELRAPPQAMNSAAWGRVKINKDERYQFLQKVQPTEDAIGDGLPELGIDFKRYFTMPTDEVYFRLGKDCQRRCRLVSPFLEHLSSRFSYYQCRVALPAEHLSEPG